MSDLWSSPDEPEEVERRRALWGFLVLGLAAVLIVGLMALFLGSSSNGKKNAAPIFPTAPPSTPSPTTHASPTGGTTAPTTAAAHTSTSPPARPVTGNPCPSTAPCGVPGDGGGAAAAVNDFRAKHGMKPVQGGATAGAQQCALSQGGGATCVPHYAWEPVESQSGSAVVGKMTGRGDGAQWLLDPGMTSFSVGWAYAPGANGAPGQWECAIVKTG